MDDQNTHTPETKAEKRAAAQAARKARRALRIAASDERLARLQAKSRALDEENARQRAEREARAKQVPMDVLGRKEEAIVQRSLVDGETLLGKVVGAGNQCVVATDQKVLIIKTGWLAGSMFGDKTTTFDYRNITSVEVRTSAAAGVFEISTGGVQNIQAPALGGDKFNAYEVPNCVPFPKNRRAPFERMASLIRSRTSNGASANAPAQRAESVPTLLAQLGELHAQGILTDDEFATKKAELLARL